MTLAHNSRPRHRVKKNSILEQPKATEKISGKGYSVIDNSELTSLPEPPPGAVFNAEEQEKYRKFKEQRRGVADYMNLEGEFSKYLEDVYSAPPVHVKLLRDDYVKQ